MAYGIQTPSLASLAAPYYEMVRRVSVTDPYAFADTVRTDYLKNAYVPAKEAGAAVEYLNNVYAARNRANTMETDLAQSAYTSRIGVANAADDWSRYGIVRPLADEIRERNLYDQAQAGRIAAEERQNQILLGEAESRYAELQSTVQGVDALDTAERIQEAVLADPLAGAALKQVAAERVIQVANEMLALYLPGTPEYDRARNTLIRTYNYGAVVPMSPSAPVAPSAPALSYGGAPRVTGLTGAPYGTPSPAPVAPTDPGYVAPIGAPPPASVAPIGGGQWSP